MELELIANAWVLWGLPGVGAVLAGIFAYRQLPPKWKDKAKSALPKVVERIKPR
jgi:hypothetical protein